MSALEQDPVIAELQRLLAVCEQTIRLETEATIARMLHENEQRDRLERTVEEERAGREKAERELAALHELMLSTPTEDWHAEKIERDTAERIAQMLDTEAEHFKLSRIGAHCMQLAATVRSGGYKDVKASDKTDRLSASLLKEKKRVEQISGTERAAVLEAGLREACSIAAGLMEHFDAHVDERLSALEELTKPFVAESATAKLKEQATMNQAIRLAQQVEAYGRCCGDDSCVYNQDALLAAAVLRLSDLRNHWQERARLRFETTKRAVRRIHELREQNEWLRSEVQHWMSASSEFADALTEARNSLDEAVQRAEKAEAEVDELQLAEYKRELFGHYYKHRKG